MEFSGVVRVDVAGQTALNKAYGLANRACRSGNTVDTRFGIASGTKGLTALTVVSLIGEGHLDLATVARSVLGADLPLIDDSVTVEHLLAHRSGIGDYFDEEVVRDLADYVMPVPVHELAATEQYLRVLASHPQKFPPGDRFSYCNSGYVVLALIAERVTGIAFPDLVEQRVCAPAGMGHTAFLRSDELPPGAAVGYLGEAGLRTNVLHLPVRGSGDGGAYSTVEDIHALWTALSSGGIVSTEWFEEMTQPRSRVSATMHYGLGFWLPENNGKIVLEGCDAGVSFRTVYDRVRQVTHTVLSNTSRGAWPIAKRLDELELCEE
jgi:CubicO group peptidase (beta-lactamase class C family)